MIKGMTNALQDYWSARISDGTYYGTSGYRSYRCHVLSPRLESFNTFAGNKYRVGSNVSTTNSWLLGEMQTCYPQESEMVGSINRRVADALVDPKVRKAELERKKKERELCEMGPWNRKLEEDPKLKAWAKANPSAAKTEMKRYIAKDGSKGSCSNLEFNYAPKSSSVKVCADVKPPQWDAEMCSKYPDAGKASGCCK